MDGIAKSKKLAQILNTKLEESKLLEKLGSLYEGKTLSQLKKLSVDITISQCLRSCSKIHSFSLENTLLFVNHLLPRLPTDIEEMFGEEQQSSGLKLSPGDCPEFVERVIKKIIDKIFDIFYKRCYDDKGYSKQLNIVFFKILSFAPKEILEEALDERFAFYAHIFLQPKCMKLNRIYMQAVFVITERLPKYSRENVLTTANVFQIKRVCEFSKETSAFFEKHRLGDILNNNLLAWQTLGRASGQLVKGQNVEAFETLSDILKRRTATPMELIGSKFIEHLEKFFRASMEKNEEDLKMFIRIVTQFSRQSFDQCSYDVAMFKQLVDYVKEALKWIQTKWEFIPDHQCTPCMHTNYGKAHYEDQMVESLLVLDYLSALSDRFPALMDVDSSFQLLPRKDFYFHITAELQD